MATVQDILAIKGNDVVTVSADDTVLEAARRMNEAKIGAVVVCEDSRCMGIFTERDVLRRVVGECRSPGTTRVGDVMTTPVTVCRPDTTLDECQAVMTRKRLRHLPVVDDERLCGMISIGDLLAREVQVQQTTIEYLNEYLLGRV